MVKIKRGTELWCDVPNRIGVVAGITKAVADTRTNVMAMASWVSPADPAKAYFRILTANNNKTTNALKKLGYTVKQTDVLLVEAPNKPGAFCPVAHKIANAGININHVYATAIGQKGIVVLSTDDNAKAIAAARQQ
jgi:hypothetical protein